MGLFAFMAPDDFPRDIVPEAVIGGVALGKAVAELRKVSLIAVKEQPEGGLLIGVHRLVQLVMRARLSEKGEAEKSAADGAHAERRLSLPGDRKHRLIGGAGRSRAVEL